MLFPRDKKCWLSKTKGNIIHKGEQQNVKKLYFISRHLTHFIFSDVFILSDILYKFSTIYNFGFCSYTQKTKPDTVKTYFGNENVEIEYVISIFLINCPFILYLLMKLYVHI